MDVQIISKTAQKFNGETYYLCGDYFQRKGKRLHRAVWEYHNGAIPLGYDIHHIDHDRSNNSLANLEMLARKDHHVLHVTDEMRRESAENVIKYAAPKAAEWHKSEAGLAWHSQQGKENWQKRGMRTYECTYCGKTFSTKYVYGRNSNRFCCGNHKAAFRRERMRNES